MLRPALSFNCAFGEGPAHEAVHKHTRTFLNYRRERQDISEGGGGGRRRGGGSPRHASRVRYEAKSASHLASMVLLQEQQPCHSVQPIEESFTAKSSNQSVHAADLEFALRSLQPNEHMKPADTPTPLPPSTNPPTTTL